MQSTTVKVYAAAEIAIAAQPVTPTNPPYHHIGQFCHRILVMNTIEWTIDSADDQSSNSTSKICDTSDNSI